VRILDRYVLREFSLFFALGLIGFIAIFVVVDAFEKIGTFLNNRAPFGLVARFYLFRVPEVVVQVQPVALLMATFLSLGQLNKFGELTAMRSLGLSLLRILAPVFGVAALATLGGFALSEAVVPRANRERDQIFEEQIQRVQRIGLAERADVTYLGAGGRIFFMRLYLVRENRMHEVSLQEFKGGRLVRRIDAAEAFWDGTRWVFTSGYLRTFDAEGREKAEPFTRIAVGGIAERPADFAKESRDPGEMNYAELSEYVRRLRGSGGRVANYLVDLHMKLAFPLLNFIVVMIGAPIATRLRMQSAALGFGLSVAIAFVFYAVMRVGQALGHTGAVPPYVGAWTGDLLFGLVGVVMLLRAQRR
jgi:lipopolysaccharide export system permease protein